MGVIAWEGSAPKKKDVSWFLGIAFASSYHVMSYTFLLMDWIPKKYEWHRYAMYLTLHMDPRISRGIRRHSSFSTCQLIWCIMYWKPCHAFLRHSQRINLTAFLSDCDDRLVNTLSPRVKAGTAIHSWKFDLWPMKSCMQHHGSTSCERRDGFRRQAAALHQIQTPQVEWDILRPDIRRMNCSLPWIILAERLRFVLPHWCNRQSQTHAAEIGLDEKMSARALNFSSA